MLHKEAVDYIRGSRERGTSDVDIRLNLIKAGWKEEDVDEAFGELQTTLMQNDQILNPSAVNVSSQLIGNPVSGQATQSSVQTFQCDLSLLTAIFYVFVSPEYVFSRIKQLGW